MARPKSQAFRIIAISTYPADIERLDGMVYALKKRGFTKASRSALIRYALNQVDITAIPRTGPSLPETSR